MWRSSFNPQASFRGQVLSSHCLVLAEAQCRGRVLSSLCNSFSRQPPQAEETLSLSRIISLDLVNACMEQLCWKCMLLNRLLKQFSMTWFPSGPRSPPVLARVAYVRGFREPGHMEAAAVGKRWGERRVGFQIGTTRWHHARVGGERADLLVYGI